MNSKIIIYYNVITHDVFNEDGTLLGNNILSAFLDNDILLEIHYVKDSSAYNPTEWVSWTGLDGLSIASSLVMDSDYLHAIKGNLVEDISGTVSTIKVSGSETSYTYTGTIQLTNSTGSSETIEYSAVTYADGVYTFTVSTTLVNSYVTGDQVRIPNALMLKVEGEDIDETESNSGIFKFKLHLLSKKILDALDYSDTTSISGIVQHKIISEGNIINTFQFPFQINNLLDFGNDTELIDTPTNTIASKAYVISFCRTKLEFQYSSDQINWHDSYTEGDIVWRIRNAHADAQWSDQQNIPVGPRGYYFIPSIDASGTLSWENNGGLENPDPVNLKGEQGYYFIPSIDASGTLSWENNGGLENPDPVNLKGERGDNGFLTMAEVLDASASGYSSGSVIIWGNPAATYQVISDTSTGETPANSPNKFILLASSGASGVSAGFGTPTADVVDLEYGSSATVEIDASGEDTSKVFNFHFGIPKGKDGSNSYLYVAYASDASGNGFSNTPSDTLKYRAEIISEDEISSPTLTDFTGVKWVKYLGDKGDTGETGPQGPQGERGEAFQFDATGLKSERSQYDLEAKGFAFLATDEGNVYIKNSATSGDWSDAIAFCGDKGDKGDTGEQGPQGPKGDTGDTGIQGPKGDKGDTGDTGAQGPKGDTGETGAAAVSFAVFTAVTDETAFAGTAQLINADGTAGETVDVVYDFNAPATGE